MDESIGNTEWLSGLEEPQQISLWDSLHDAVLEHATFDPESKVLRLIFRINHLNRFHSFPADLRFVLSTGNVHRLKATEFENWHEFERRLRLDTTEGNVFEADLATSANGLVALRFFMHVDDTCYPEVVVHGEGIEVSTTDARSLTLEKFMALGERYWEEFAHHSAAPSGDFR